MTAALLFATTFVVVFALAVQQLNVSAGFAWAAFATSAVISSANWVLFKHVPQPTGWWDFAGYTLGGCCGVVAAMRLHPWLVDVAMWIKYRRQS
jgi:hypothetical protein